MARIYLNATTGCINIILIRWIVYTLKEMRFQERRIVAWIWQIRLAESRTSGGDIFNFRFILFSYHAISF